MNMNVEQLLGKVLDSFSEFDYIRTGDIPTIDLYMDQVTTFMDSKLKNTTRNPEEDKILTKTMINNYAKSDLLPPPVRKKYTKEHLLVMIFIYYFKSVMSIGDIEVILNPITERYFGKSGMGMKDIYTEILKLMDYCLINPKKVDLAMAKRYFAALFPNITLCAVNVDTQEEFEAIKQSVDFRLYEGNFYQLPITKGEHKVAPLKVNYINLINCTS